MSFFIGIFSGSDGISGYSDILFLIVALILGILVGMRDIFKICIILCIALAGYTYAVSSYESRIQSITHMEPLIGQKIYVIGTVDKKLYKTELNQAYRLYIDNFDTISPHIGDIDKENQSLLIELPENLTIGVGDILSFTGKIEPLYEGSIDGFERYTLYNNLSAKVRISNFSRIKDTETKKLEGLSKIIQEHIFKGFPRDTAGIILGMTIGDTELMSQGVKESFRLSGISHILVVSGSNITFLIVLIGGILKYLPINRYMRIISIYGFVLLYSMLVGWDVPVVRSAIMGLLGYYALEQQTRLSSIAVVLGVGIGFLMYSPLSLMYDPAFGLSFAATMSIILYYKRLYSITEKWNIPGWIGSIVALSIAATIGTIPVVLYHFSEISIGSILANIAIAGVVGWILFASVWYMLLGFLGTGFLYMVGYLIYIPVQYIIYMADWFGSLGMYTPREDIKNIIILVCIVFFISEILGSLKMNHLPDQKEDDHL